MAEKSTIDMEFEGHTGRELIGARMSGTTFIANPPVLSKRAEWKKKHMESVKGEIKLLQSLNLVPEETIFIFSGKKKHPVDSAYTICDSYGGTVFHAVSIASFHMDDYIEDYGEDLPFLKDSGVADTMKRLFIHHILLHEIGHFVLRKGDRYDMLSGEDEAERYAYEKIMKVISTIESDPCRMELLRDRVLAVVFALRMDLTVEEEEKKVGKCKSSLEKWRG